MTSPRPGDLIVFQTNGRFSNVIRFGQHLRWHKLKTKSGKPAWKYNHVGVYAGNDVIIEADPGGVRRSKLSAYNTWEWDIVRVEGDRSACIREAERWIRTPYGWADISAFFFLCLGADYRWIETICTRIDTVVCSQLGALSALAAGDQRFKDPYVRLPVHIAVYAE